MIEFLEELRRVGINALFDPVLLFLLVVLFFAGKLVGWFTRDVGIWKFLALGYFAVFLFRPLQDAGLVIGGVFILGVLSMHANLFRSIFRWSGNWGDMLSAVRYRSTYDDIRRLEDEIADLKRQLHASQAGTASSGATSQQQQWRAQSRSRKAQSQSKDADSDGRGDGGGGGSRSRAHRDQSQSRNGTHRGSKKRSNPDEKKSSAQSTQSRRSGGRTQSSQSSTSTSQRKSSSQGSQSQAQGRGQRASSQRTSSNAGQSQGTNQAKPPPVTPSIRDRHLETLELNPGQTYTEKEIKAAWRKVAFKTHPDRGGSAAAFSAAYDAYKALS